MPEDHVHRIDDEMRVQDSVTPALLNLGPVTVRAGARLDLTVGTPPEKTTASLAEWQWLMGTTVFGSFVGGLAFPTQTGHALGAIAGLLLGYRRWRQVHDED